MNTKILFVAPIPSEENIKDGMIQRIEAIDNLFKEFDRSYLNLSFFKKRHLTHVLHKNRNEYKGNVFLHPVKIISQLRKADIIYIHSVFSAIHLMPYIWFIPKDTEIILDCHGIVPEETRLLGKKNLAIVYGYIEQFFFKRANTKYVYVTEKMKSYYESKYKINIGKGIVYPIFPKNLFREKDPIDNESYLVEKYKISKGDVVIIYSGNLQVWQNIEAMLKKVKNNLCSNYKYIFLTGQPIELKQMLLKLGIKDDDNVFVESVLPDKLDNYYELAHYGFILRDDIIVNRLANPTKMIEYLKSGIIPVVKSAQIGDFYEMGYDYLPEHSFNIDLYPKKSPKNITIAEKILNGASSTNFFDFVLNQPATEAKKSLNQ